MSVRRLGGPLLLVVSAASAAAQADSLAGAAREHYRGALAAAREGTPARARDLAVLAARAWSGQPAYAWAAALFSARLADTAGTARWLGHLADLGGWRDLRADSAFRAVIGAPPVARAVERLEANRRPLARSAVAFTLAGGFFAEGIDADPATGAWYVTSVRHGTVTRVDPRGESHPFAGPPDLEGAAFGVRVDAVRRLLWVTTRVSPYSGAFVPGTPERAGVVVLDLATGAVRARATLADSVPHTLGDLVLAPDGSAYLSDSESPTVYRARLSARGRLELERWAASRLFRSLQGLALDPAGGTLYAADYSHGILAIDTRSAAVREVPGAGGFTTVGIDGLSWWAGSLVGIQNGVIPPRVVRLRLDGSGARIAALEVLDRNPVATEPTIGTVVGDTLYYVADSHWPFYDEGGRLRPGARPGPTHVLALPLPRG